MLSKNPYDALPQLFFTHMIKSRIKYTQVLVTFRQITKWPQPGLLPLLVHCRRDLIQRLVLYIMVDEEVRVHGKRLCA